MHPGIPHARSCRSTIALLGQSRPAPPFTACTPHQASPAPIFSAIWAIADQYNGAPLGFAAPAVARLKKGEITDVVDTSVLSVDNLSGTVFDDSGSTFYNTEAIFSLNVPAITQTNYLAAITPGGEISGSIHTAYAIAFGADSSLTVGTGWDNVTGFGEPNGFPFIIGVSLKKK